MTETTSALALDDFTSLEKSDRMPVLFVGHGSPMNAIGDNEYRRSWQELGAAFGSQYPPPQLVLCISAHWLTEGWWVTGMAQPRTIHDFGGFPQELFDQQYPAPGAPAAAREISRFVRQRASAPLGVDLDAWGLDHGAWSVLQPMFPAADIPVVQLSMDYSRPPSDHYALAKQLKGLRERGVLIVGSGNIVHNLRQAQRGAAGHQAYDWALEFDQTTGGYIQQGNLDALQNFQKLGQLALMAHPTHEHYLPLLYAAAAVDSSEAPRFFNTSFQFGSISMRSVIWG
ncbi:MULTISPECIES: 4,5-DOPA dioxygenase extradiol [unclassified Polaromonas]|uniref:4,5-DOPA-extradiol-dioxygenase n=1 Tax=unclassified Polaromonas TaxID=2638319 RepID=UPI000BD42505|nr:MULTISPECIES: 4,5-DOPA dioxygenase extradiol [unclassified Polaromonas]OYY39056.1 MAG: 4,5-DOPA dioxygenase extradiol [Polaromonas sp. 35-63-35]OYZ21921.1 MAG: 4,5-DOPA dioxygenase extradiol [Polaromonas sp. 16-63-31]OYZ80358.1 MAG: 4,5-DOPA dioxygenase extradiol [Polaromonas sp. 24-63-21]OZA51422.1 MAG: 4,5-DOPA dioxygenase extradiol [Polaromonas sp. 17-63-33]OZA90107.1 MAG: 4,5-DOPA dioxygenase extradiol [Polaromonas sp. 39-63-25]